MKYLMVLASLPLFGCGAASNHSEEDPVGRYEITPATADMPALILDTKTGCLERLVKMTSVENPKDVWWVRKYMDGAMPVVSNGEVVPNSAPPARCKTMQGQTK